MKGSEPAYPVSEETTDRIKEGVEIYSGMTMRDYIATQAMTGLLQSYGMCKDVIKDSYSLADSMIKQSEEVNNVGS